jgi:DHA2 family multidrug resistance protein-like MFS transporter
VQTVAASPRAGAREWAGLAVLVLPCLLVSMDVHVLNLAIPQLTADLRPTGAQLLWIVDAYAFLVAGCLLPMGALGDRVGRRRLLLTGAAGFAAASLLAAFARSPAMLIAARALLGVAGATLMPSTLSLIRAMFADSRQRTTAFGVWTASFALGGVIAPVVAGLLLARFWWGSVFLVAVPFVAVLLALGPTLLPEVRDPRADPVDAASALLCLAAVLSAVFGFKRAVQVGADVPACAALAAGLVLAAAFLRRQRRQEHPWLDPELFRRLTFSMPLATNALSFFVLYGTQFLVAQYLQLVLGLSALQAGLWTIPSALAYLAGSALAPVAASRVRLPWFLGLSLAVSAAGFGLLTQLGQGSGLPVVVAATVVFSVGLAPVYVLATELIVASAPPERSGTASGVHESAAELGGACGIAVLGSIAAAAYRQAMSTARPRALDPGRWEDARRTLGGAMATAARLPEPLAAKVAGDARHAFTVALQTVEMLGSGVLAMLAVASVLVLRRGTLRPCPRPSSPTARSAGSSSPAGS